MNALLTSILAVAVQASAPVPPVPAPLAAPVDWSHVPSLPWRVPPHVTPELIDVVEQEMGGGRCPRPAGVLIVEMVVLVRSDGGLRAVVPRAIDCPAVEQFAAGLVTRFARNNLRQPVAGWYRTAITFERR